MASLRAVYLLELRAFSRTQPAARQLAQGTWKAAQWKRSFSGSVCRSRPPPRVQAKRSRTIKLSESEYREHQQPPPPREPLGSGSPTLIVGSIIGACASLFAYTAIQDAEFRARQSKNAYQWLQTIDKHFTLSIKNVKEGRFYVFLTHTLAHATLPHLAFNMLALWGFGRIIISWYGIPTFAIIWVGSAVIGGVLQMGYWVKYNNHAVEHKAVGCSGSIFGLVSALSFIYPTMPVSLLLIPMNLRWMMVISVAFSLGSLREGWLPSLGHVDHLGGMAFGFVWWAIALRRGRMGRLVL